MSGSSEKLEVWIDCDLGPPRLVGTLAHDRGQIRFHYERAWQPYRQTWYTTKQVATRFGVSVATVWRWVADGSLSKPVMVTQRASRWPESGLLEFEARCLSGAFAREKKIPTRRRAGV